MKSTAALLFINGTAPAKLPDHSDYGIVACTDGAFHYLKEKGFPVQELDFISGDFDSHHGEDDRVFREKFIFTPDQDLTDFHKALTLLLEKGVTDVRIYGGSGGEMDHFLGNLTTAAEFFDQLNIRFTDDYSDYFLVAESLTLQSVKGRMISLYPFPAAQDVTTKGLNWELDSAQLSVNKFISTRNFATQDNVEIKFREGMLIIFISHLPYGEF